MIADIITIMQKELKELLFQRARFRGGWVGMLVFMGAFGVLMPMQSGIAWVENSISLIYWSWIPFLLVSTVVADSFAGEKERHTLETLLASRLSDKAILFGKIATAISYGWGLTMVSVIISLITINVAFGEGKLLLYPWSTMLAIPIISLLVAGLATGLGILVSLRASTVRQAQQTFSIAFFAIFIPIFIFPLLPEEIQARIVNFVLSTNWTTLGVIAAIIILVLDCFLIFLCINRFKRNRLILD